ncbi:MAG TPA: sulfatase-like hydrolase/transferase, partial [Gemmatimonadales bacterium]
VLACTLVGCAVLYAAARLFRGRRALTALVVFLVILGFYAVVPLAEWVVDGTGSVGGLALLLVPLGAAVVLLRWLIRRPASLEGLTTFLALTSLIVVVWLSARIVMDQARARSAIHNSALARELAQPVRIRAGKPSAVAKPDIYLLVLDEYANSSVLREQFNFDNREFEDSLRQLGFTIPRSVHSNYTHTILSLPSLLNFSHLNGLTTELGSTATDPSLPIYLLQHNRTVTFLRGQGYRFVLYPSQWWPATQHSTEADSEYQAWHGFSLGRELTRSHFRRTLTEMTPLGQIFRQPPYDGDHVRRTLEALASVRTGGKPTFAFAHIMNPHYPYVFESDCRPVPPHGAKRKRVAYVNQLRCLDRMVLSTVTALIQRSPTPPVILLQGDHGTSTLNFSWAPDAAAVSPAQARERFGAFGAYYLPNGGSRLVSDSVTIVNVLQKVLGYYLAADVAASPDDMYMSIERRPYAFVRVDPATLVPPAAR